MAVLPLVHSGCHTAIISGSPFFNPRFPSSLSLAQKEEVYWDKGFLGQIWGRSRSLPHGLVGMDQASVEAWGRFSEEPGSLRRSRQPAYEGSSKPARDHCAAQSSNRIRIKLLNMLTFLLYIIMWWEMARQIFIFQLCKVSSRHSVGRVIEHKDQLIIFLLRSLVFLLQISSLFLLLYASYRSHDIWWMFLN